MGHTTGSVGIDAMVLSVGNPDSGETNDKVFCAISYFHSFNRL